jgi:hypothetical protein
MRPWKLRATVYALLVFVATLTVWQSGVFAKETPEPSALHGTTVDVRVGGSQVLGVAVERMGGVCGSRPSAWRPALGQRGVDWRQDGLDLMVHEHSNAGHWQVDRYVKAAIAPRGDRIAGSIWSSARRGSRSCDSRLVSFSASPPR